MFDKEAILPINPNIQRNNITPIRYKGDGTGDAINHYNNNCLNDIDYTNGEILFSFSQMINQVSCNPFTGNGGNWYSWPAATAGGYHATKGYNELSSVCPKGWQLTVNAATDPKSYYYLIRTIYNMQENNDSRIRLLPMSFVRSGYYGQGSLDNNIIVGYYWSSTVIGNENAYSLGFTSGSLVPQYDNPGYSKKYYGYSVRCVSR